MHIVFWLFSQWLNTVCAGLEQLSSLAWVQLPGVPNNLWEDCVHISRTGKSVLRCPVLSVTVAASEVSTLWLHRNVYSILVVAVVVVLIVIITIYRVAHIK